MRFFERSADLAFGLEIGWMLCAFYDSNGKCFILYLCHISLYLTITSKQFSIQNLDFYRSVCIVAICYSGPI